MFFFSFTLVRIILLLFWIAVCIFSMFLERKEKQLYFIHVIVSSFIVTVYSFFTDAIKNQLVVFIILFIFIRIIIQPFINQKRIRRIFENQICTFIGNEAIVSKDISKDKRGEVNFYGIVWDAITKEDDILTVGMHVLIKDKEDLNLVVSKIENN